jgi:hypothetical protein
MIKCFLSHSSKDKAAYVQVVADLLPKQWRVYDSDTFEAGMNTLDEILRTLDESSLFVLFISNTALESEWVKREITEARRLDLDGKMRKIFPLIIDKAVLHSDPRIPDWMRDVYNLHAVVRPSVAVRRIQQRLRELSWESHPRLKERQKIFVGRNDEIKQFEERFDDYDKAPPTCVICAGMQVMGRKTLIRHGLTKAGRLKESYVPPIIQLTSQESIEDFIFKLRDLGMVDLDESLQGLMSLDLKSKIEIAASMCAELDRLNEIVVVEDAGAIITYERELAPWFKLLLDQLLDKGCTVLAIASRFRANFRAVRRDDIFYTTVSELSVPERMGLFKRIAEFEGLNLSTDDYSYFKELLYGFPEQVFYAVTLIKEMGLAATKRKTELLIDFNTERAAKLIARYASTQTELDFLYLLSEFDFISYDLLDSLMDDKGYGATLEKFIAGSVCENLGANGEYVRVNDSIRDFMRRSGLQLPAHFAAKMRAHAAEYLQLNNDDVVDASDYLFSLKRALIENTDIESKLLIPSHFLKAMKELYDRRRDYQDVIKLADRVLSSSSYLDQNIDREIRYFLCLSLARERDARFLQEVQHVKGPEHDFLLGFYYRMCRRTADAIERQKAAIQHTRTASRARRELVQLYVEIEDFSTATELAKQNYEGNTSNPFHIQAYLKCLINSPDWSKNDHLIIKLLGGLDSASSTFDRAGEMRLSAKAQYEAYCLGNFSLALNTIDDAIARYPNNPYPLLTKIGILFRSGAASSEITPLINLASRQLHGNGLLVDAVSKMQAQLYYLEGRTEEFEKVTTKLLRNLPADLRTPLLNRLKHFSSDIGLPNLDDAS